jgi:hypothetical protein
MGLSYLKGLAFSIRVLGLVGHVMYTTLAKAIVRPIIS